MTLTEHAGGIGTGIRRAMSLAIVAIALGLGAGSSASASAPVVLDNFDEGLGAWTMHPAAGVDMKLVPDAGMHGKSMRIDFHFAGGGWAIARRSLDLTLPANYEFSFLLRGQAPVNHLEFKLIDPSGENVWWNVHRDYRWPAGWERIAIKKRQISFAWGPAGGGEIPKVAALEIVVTAGTGGTGSIWIDDLELKELPPPGAVPPAPIATASSSSMTAEASDEGLPMKTAQASDDGLPSAAVDGDTLTAWRSAPDDPAPTLTLDLGTDREFGGLLVDWAPGLHAENYDIEISPDGGTWRTLRSVRGSNGGRDPLLLTESEARYLRLQVRRDIPERGSATRSGQPRPSGTRPGETRPVEAPPAATTPASASGVALRELTIMPLEWGSSPEVFYRHLAESAPRGFYPRGMLGLPEEWTLVGPGKGNVHEGLLDTDGRLESGKACWSIEPFLYAGGRLLTWNELRPRPSLRDGDLPIPIVEGFAREAGLRVTAFATDSAMVARYVIRNQGAETQAITLYLALRPFQVDPPAQFLNTPGGVAPIRSIRRAGRTVFVNEASGADSAAAGDGNAAASGVDATRQPGLGLICLDEPTAFAALTFDEGDLVSDYLAHDRLPPSSSADDPTERASGILAWKLELAPGQEREVAVQIPLAGPPRESDAIIARDQAEAAVAADWRAVEDAVQLDLPTPQGREIAATIRAQLAWILINRHGAAIQPGSRSYDRSWIRDGSLTSTALLRLGQFEVVRDFLVWFASYQYPDGKVPCCIDSRGSDPVPEHDSHGELIYLAAEYYRYTGDRETALQIWPAVARAAAYLDTLRAQRRTPEWREPGKEEFYGLLPPSISHEGYSAKPMHSYWDDFFALRGLNDAVFLATELGLGADAQRLARDRNEFTHDLQASLVATLRAHSIDYVPGCADLGDFDATSTTIALAPCAATSILPPGALERTFEKYWEFFRERRDGKPWEAFTPYEMRTIGSFVRLGWRDRVQELLAFFLHYRRPEAWRQWPEVVWSDSTTQHFVGDMPHTWCGSDFVRSALDMLAYDRDEDSTLVLAAGVPMDWLTSGGGIRVRNLATPYGRLSYSAAAAGAGSKSGATVTMTIDAGLRVPSGGLVVALPVGPVPRGRTMQANVNGRAAEVDATGRVVVRELPAAVAVRW